MQVSDQTRIEQQDQAAQERYFDASGDAAFGMMPRYADSVYMSGYAHGLQSLPTNDKGEILYSPVYSNITEF
jgi:hypothetical protein